MFSFNILDIEFELGSKKINVKENYPSGERVINATGIPFVYETEDTAENLATKAAKRLLDNVKIVPDCIIYVTQSQQDVLPGSGTILHQNLELPKSTAIFDVNAGCSGFVQALILSASLINNYNNILIICADTYRKKLSKEDRSTNVVFSDGASAAFVKKDKKLQIKKILNQTYSKGREILNQKKDGLNEGKLHMSGRELWDFTRVNIVPDILHCIKILKDDKNSTDVFIHQASKLVVNGIKKEIDLDINLHENYSLRGNTVSSTLPILLKDSNFGFKKNFVLSGFGVGIFSYTLAIEKI